MPLQFKAMLFDFDGVLCRGRFWEGTLSAQHADAYAWIQDHIFGDRTLVRAWMRGDLTEVDVINRIATGTNVSSQKITDTLHESVDRFVLDASLLAWIQLHKGSAVKIALVTDNMDVFERVVRTHHLDSLFDVVINSSKSGCLKSEQGGRLFSDTLSTLGVAFAQTLLIDDSAEAIKQFEDMGGHGFLYTTFEQFVMDPRRSLSSRRRGRG